MKLHAGLAIVVFACVFLGPQRLAVDQPERFIVWNVGQGEWTSLISSTACIHFDMGGERMDWKSLSRLCGARDNLVYYSHWDWDHIGLTLKAYRRLQGRLCIAGYPGGEPSSRHKQDLLLSLPACDSLAAFDRVRLLKLKPGSLRRARTSSSNSSSDVYVANQAILIPGDSPSTAERIWVHNLKAEEKIKILILGHHGSRTSSSIELLQALPHLKMGIASQRTERYGHPHAQVAARLKARGIALLKTEDWGNLHLFIGEKRTSADKTVRRIN